MIAVPSQMLREIRQQPQALAATFAAVDERLGDVAALAAGCRQVVLVGRGTSDNAAVYGRWLCETQALLPAWLGTPSTATLYRAALDLRGTLAVVLSQSGATAEIVETAAWARSRGARVLGITNGVATPLHAACDVTLETAAGDELAVPATKTHTGQLLALALAVSAISPAARGLCRSAEAAVAACEPLVERAAGPAAEAAEGLGRPGHLVAVGRGPTQATAQEVALKVEETSAIPCRGLSLADLQHGPLAIVGPETPAIVLAASGVTASGLAAIAGRLAERGAEVIAVSDDDRVRRAAGRTLPAPDVDEAAFPLLAVVPGQLLAEALARRAGRDPDQPEALTKVTQTVH